MTAVSWFDGCGTQLTPLVTEGNMTLEKKLKICCCKHSTARTAVEQAADTGPMFKVLKSLLRSTETPTVTNNSIFHYLQQKINLMSPNRVDSLSNRVINIPAFKKKAIIATISKIPIAASRAYSDSNIKKAFIMNSQLDISNKVVPSFLNILNTYRGDNAGTCLEEKEELFRKFYDEAYFQGMVSEDSFTKANVPMDTNSKGDIIEQNMGISLENRQRAKSLSSNAQIEQRRDRVHEELMKKYRKMEKLYLCEHEEYNMNNRCENMIVKLYKEQMKNNGTSTDGNDVSNLPVTNGNPQLSFHEIADKITYHMVKLFAEKIRKLEIRAFVRVRSQSAMKGGRIAYTNVPILKPLLASKMFELITVPVKDKLFPTFPVLPIRPGVVTTNTDE